MLKKLIAGAVAFMLTFSAVGVTREAHAQEDYTSQARQLDKLAYEGDDLGAVYSPENTVFKVWAPTASKVELKLYKTGSDQEKNAGLIAQSPMEYNPENGVWTVTKQGDLNGVYYTYLVTVEGKTNETADIYAKAAGVNGERSMVVDLDATDPDNWENDRHILFDHQTQATVWEVHIKDFSSSPSSGVSQDNRGKYLAFTEEGTTLNGEGEVPTCVDYLKALGVNCVQINPFYDFGSVDESKTDDQEAFNWGYDPKNYNLPEGSYSSNPYDGAVRIREAKQMIQALHDAGIAVVMDVVYNHTYTGEDSFFNKTVPNYYYRFHEDGSWANGSGCGNDTASERAMYRKFMVDSVAYWVEEYHIDGFRFDLMGLHDVETMNAIREKLDSFENGEKLIMYGEAWEMAQATDATMACQDNMHLLNERIGAFNDGMRDILKGDNFQAADIGFIQGRGAPSLVKKGIKAATDEWALQPSQTVSYMSCHDNMTLYDKLVASVLGEKEDYRARNEQLVQMNKLGACALLTSQGIAFMLAGEEMARSKDGDHNSYQSSVQLNQIDWNNLALYGDLAAYYMGLLAIRNNFAPFTQDDNTSVAHMVFYENTDKHVVAYTLENTVTNATQWDAVTVLLNSNTDKDVTVQLEGAAANKDWVIVADGQSAGLTSLGEITDGKAVLPRSSAMVLVDKESFARVKLDADLSLQQVLQNAAGTVEEDASQAQASSTAQQQTGAGAQFFTGHGVLWLLGAAAAAVVAIAGFVFYKKRKNKK